MHPRTSHSVRGIALALAAVLSTAAGVAAQSADSVRQKLTVRSFIDYGHLVNGHNTYYQSAGLKNSDISMMPLNRANVSFVQEVAVGRFDVQAGLSGLIWWPYGLIQTDADQRAMTVKPMIPVARARWQFGDPAAPSSFQIGTFNYKYNPDAKDLGEYLYRSGTYPGYLWSNEGWLLFNRAGNYSHGALLTLSQFNGALKHNFSLFMETQYAPVGDFSPGYDAGYKSKWFEVGGGVVLNHYLSTRPSTLRPKDLDNTYIRVDTGGGNYYGPQSLSPVLIDPADTTQDWEVLHRWTQKGIKVMGRAALNLNSLLPPDMRNPEDLRIFGEAAVLGWEDQPLYYEDRSERIPVMFGVNIPTFKLLDVLTLQGEYYKSRFNDMEFFSVKSLPIWNAYPLDSTGNVQVTRDADGKLVLKSTHNDDFKWSLYARKTVNKVVTIHAQAASDHFRLTDGKFKPSSVPLTSQPSEWYYLLRLEFQLR